MGRTRANDVLLRPVTRVGPSAYHFSDQFRSLEFSQDSELLVGFNCRGPNPGELVVWRVRSGEVLLKTPTWASFATFADSGRLLLVIGNGIVTVFDLTTGRKRLSLPNKNGGIITDDGRLLATAASANGEARLSIGGQPVPTTIWTCTRTLDETALWQYSVPARASVCAAFTRDGSRFVLFGQDVVICLNARDGKPAVPPRMHSLRSSAGSHGALTISPSGRFIAAHADKAIDGETEAFVIDVAANQKYLGFAVKGAVRSMGFLADEPTLMVVTSTGVELFDCNTGRLRWRWAGPAESTQERWKPNEYFLTSRVVGCPVVAQLDEREDAVTVFTLSSNDDSVDVVHRKAERPVRPTALALSPDGRLLATADTDCMLRIEAIDGSGPLKGPAEDDGPVTAVAISPDGSTFAAGWAGGGVRAWTAADGTPLGCLIRCNGGIRGLCFTAQGDHVIALDTNGGLRSFSLPSMGTVGVAELNCKISCARLFDGGAALFARDSGTLEYSPDMVRHRLLGEFRPPTTLIRFAQNGRRSPCIAVAGPPSHVVASGAPDVLASWAINAGRVERLRDVPKGRRSMSALALSPDGRTLVQISIDDVLVFSDPVMGRYLDEMCMHDDVRVAVFVDSKRLLLFGVADAATVLTFDRHPERLFTRAFTITGRSRLSTSNSTAGLCILSPDGRRILVGQRNGAAVLYDIIRAARTDGHR